MTPGAQQGLFAYGGQTINVLSVAAANGQVSTIDPTVKKLLADIYSSTSAGTLQARSDPNVMDFNYTADASLGTLTVDTELGRISLDPQEIAVIPRGLRFNVDLAQSDAR
jgi:hypothetical protein